MLGDGPRASFASTNKPMTEAAKRHRRGHVFGYDDEEKSEDGDHVEESEDGDHVEAADRAAGFAAGPAVGEAEAEEPAVSKAAGSPTKVSAAALRLRALRDLVAEKEKEKEKEKEARASEK